jgi:hypothetical protein
MGWADERDKSMPRATIRSQARRYPAKAEWDALMAQVESEPVRRTLISHEDAAEASDEMARRLVDELSPDRTHIAMTLRAPAERLPAEWIQRLKKGESRPFSSWLQNVYDPGLTLPRSHDLAALVERWSRIVGPQNVTVMVVDRADPDLLTETFEQLLGLPERTLSGRTADGYTTNRSMSLPEAEVFRQLNERIYESEKTPWRLYLDVVGAGAINQVLANRALDHTEPRLRLPGWAAERAVEDGKGYAERIAQSGVRVVGNLANLYRWPPTTDGEPRAEDGHYRSIAVEALSGAFQGALKSEAHATRQIAKARKIHRKPVPESDENRTSPEKITAQGDASCHRATELKPHTVAEQLKSLPATAKSECAANSLTMRELVRAAIIQFQHKLRAGRFAISSRIRADPPEPISSIPEEDVEHPVRSAAIVSTGKGSDKFS